MKDLILTLDAGTTGLKCTLFTAAGHVYRKIIVPYNVEMPRPGWAQQPALWLVNAAIDGINQLLEEDDPARVAVIGLSGTMNGCIPIDGNGEALYANIIHSDMRAMAQLAQISAVIDEKEYYAHTGNPMDMHYTLPKILWLRENHPDVYRRTRWFINAKDAIYGWLTGRHGYTDYSDASMTGALNINMGKWDDSLLSTLGIKPSLMPQILPSHDVSGTLTKEAALALGLPEGLPVSIGASDAACATHGAGIHAPGDAYINIGLSAWMATLSDTPVLDEQMRFFNFLDMDGKHQTVCSMVQTSTAAVDWVIQNILTDDKPLTPETYDLVEEMAEAIMPGAEGVFFLPTMMGEKTPWWDPDARGTYIGMTLSHDRRHMARAAFEGVAQALHLCDSVLQENGLVYPNLSIIGGGAQSNMWPQMIADMLDMPTRVHTNPREAISLGAAMAAGVGVGLYANYQEAASIARFDEDYMPDAVRQEPYQRHYEVYRALYGQIQGAYRGISAYQQERMGQV